MITPIFLFRKSLFVGKYDGHISNSLYRMVGKISLHLEDYDFLMKEEYDIFTGDKPTLEHILHEYRL